MPDEPKGGSATDGDKPDAVKGDKPDDAQGDKPDKTKTYLQSDVDAIAESTRKITEERIRSEYEAKLKAAFGVHD